MLEVDVCDQIGQWVMSKHVTIIYNGSMGNEGLCIKIQVNFLGFITRNVIFLAMMMS